MNTFTNSTRTLSIAFAALLLLATPFVLASKAHAADFGGDYGDYYSGDYSDYGDYYSGDYSNYGDYYSGDYTDYGSQDYAYTNYGSQDYGYSDYGSSYDSGYGYSSGYGSSYIPYYSSYIPSYPVYPSQASNTNVNTNTNVNNNTCVNGCNNSSSVGPTTIITNPAPVYQQQYQSCTTCGCTGYPSCYTQPTYNNPPVTYNTTRAPYVSLAAVPYTGLDLGPWGTVLYWGFLVFWCLVAAYLIAVKRVHNKFVAWLTGSNTSAAAPVARSHSHAPVAPAPKAAASAPDQFAGIDPFIASQIKRASF